MKTEKRKPGGQAGNQNARKHGFYSGTLSHEELEELWNDVNVQHLDLDIAMLNLKVKMCVQRDPGNPDIVGDVARLITKSARGKYSLSRKEAIALKQIFEDILRKSLE